MMCIPNVQALSKEAAYLVVQGLALLAGWSQSLLSCQG